MDDFDRESYLSVIDDGGRVIAQAAQAGPATPVPPCPGWRLRDLAFHVGCVMRFWTEAIGARTRPEPVDARVPPPPDNRLETFVLDGVHGLLDELVDAGDDTPAWTWWNDGAVQGIPRRLALETAVHRWDAAEALSDPHAIPPGLAADGVEEFFDVVVQRTGHPSTGPRGAALLAATDVGRRWIVDVGDSGHARIARSAATGDATGAHVRVRGTAAQLLLLLWRRLSPSSLHVAGDFRFLAGLLAHPDLE